MIHFVSEQIHVHKCDKFQLPATFNNYFKLITDIYPHNTKQTKTRQLALPNTRPNSGEKMLRYNHGRRKGGRGALAPPWILKFSAKKVVFLVLRGKNQISPSLAPPGKILENSPSAPLLEKILPTPMDTIQ